jgi:competence protein ComEC
MNKGLAFIKHLPFASINKLWISALDYTLLYGIISLCFYFLFNRNKRLLKYALYLTLVLTVGIAWKKIDSQTTNNITFLNLKKQRAIVFKTGSSAVVLSDLKPSNKNYRYSIQPGLDSAKVEEVTVFSFDQDIDLPFVKKHGNFVRFLNKNLVIIDDSTGNLDLLQKVNVDYAYLTRMPRLKMEEINKNFKTSLLVISADNSDRYLDNVQKQLLRSNNKYYILKRNKALNLVSN